MPALVNAKHEAFVQHLAKGLAASRAYIAVYKTQDIRIAESSASRLLSYDKVKSRLAEVQGEIAKAVAANVASETTETIQSITAELNEAYRMAKDQAQPNHMIAASMAKAKLNGLVVDKAETTVTTKHEERVNRRREAIERAKHRVETDGEPRADIH